MHDDYRHDRVLRTYAHTAWTHADPLAGLPKEVREAILLMPSTWRERLKVGLWTNKLQRRMAIAEIIAERRLAYELATGSQTQVQPATREASPATPVLRVDPGVVDSPYYRYRLQRDAIAAVKDDRRAQDAADRASDPRAQADFEQREARRRALADVDYERARLDLRELAILSGREAAPERQERPTRRRDPRPSPTSPSFLARPRRKDRDR